MSKEESLKTNGQTQQHYQRRTSSTTCACARAREGERMPIFQKELYIEELKARYEEAVGYRMQPFVEAMLVEKLENGYEIDVLVNAIEITGWAPRPSAHYLRAILQRYEAEGIFTWADVEADAIARRRRAELKRTDC